MTMNDNEETMNVNEAICTIQRLRGELYAMAQRAEKAEKELKACKRELYRRTTPAARRV
jgi:hypothetical protein